MKLTFKVDAERITLNQMIAMQDGDLRTARDVLAAALVNGNGEYMELEEAKVLVGNLNLAQVKEASDEVGQQLENLAINPTTGGD